MWDILAKAAQLTTLALNLAKIIQWIVKQRPPRATSRRKRRLK